MLPRLRYCWRIRYDEKLKRYQGEVVGKRDILERFERKLAAAEGDTAALTDEDWDGVWLILDALRRAFHPADERALIESERADAQE